MKYVILLGDGMADYPLEELGGKTPLEAARTPNLDIIARKGTLGLIDTIPPGMIPGSDVANLSVLGYDPARYFTGRGPLEAANMGVCLAPDDIAFRCNLVTLSEGNDPVMDDYSAGHISTPEAEDVIRQIGKELDSDRIQFYPGVSYRHLMVWKRGMDGIGTAAPHDILGERAVVHLPSGKGAEEIIQIMERAKGVLRRSAVNAKRISAGKRPANAIWLWGQGKAPAMVPMTEKYGITGGIISAVNLLNGIGHYAGLEIIRVKGMTGYIDTNFEGKARGAIDALRRMDFVFVHVEAPDEMGHEGNIEGKIKAIELFDEKVVGAVLAEFPSLGKARVIVLSDHPTPIRLKTHVSDPSPFAALSSETNENMGGSEGYGEKAAVQSGVMISPGHTMLDHLIRDWRGFIGKKR